MSDLRRKIELMTDDELWYRREDIYQELHEMDYEDTRRDLLYYEETLITDELEDRADHDEKMEDEEYYYEMTDVEADADTLASAGWGTDEDYGYYGDDFGDW